MNLRLACLLLSVVSLACGSVSAPRDGAAGAGGGGTGGAAATDAASDTPATADGGDAATTACNPTSPFGAATAVAGLNSTSREDGLSLSPDGLIAYISSYRAGTVDNIYTATRAATDQPFGTPTIITSIMSGSAVDFAPRITTDGLRLYFSSTRAGGSTAHIFLATRTSAVTVFGTASQLAVVNSTSDDRDQYLTRDEQTIVFASTRNGGGTGSDLYIADRTGGGSFGTPARISELSGTTLEYLPVLSEDKLTIYFGSDRTDAPAKGGGDIWMAHRTTPGGTFGTPQNVAELNTAGEDDPLWLSSDGCTLYFAVGPAANLDIYQARRAP